jgi:hypothetical protein
LSTWPDSAVQGKDNIVVVAVVEVVVDKIVVEGFVVVLDTGTEVVVEAVVQFAAVAWDSIAVDIASVAAAVEAEVAAVVASGARVLFGGVPSPPCGQKLQNFEAA